MTACWPFCCCCPSKDKKVLQPMLVPQRQVPPGPVTQEDLLTTFDPPSRRRLRSSTSYVSLTTSELEDQYLPRINKKVLQSERLQEKMRNNEGQPMSPVDDINSPYIITRETKRMFKKSPKAQRPAKAINDENEAIGNTYSATIKNKNSLSNRNRGKKKKKTKKKKAKKKKKTKPSSENSESSISELTGVGPVRLVRPTTMSPFEQAATRVMRYPNLSAMTNRSGVNSSMTSESCGSSEFPGCSSLMSSELTGVGPLKYRTSPDIMSQNCCSEASSFGTSESESWLSSALQELPRTKAKAKVPSASSCSSSFYGAPSSPHKGWPKLIQDKNKKKNKKKAQWSGLKSPPMITTPARNPAYSQSMSQSSEELSEVSMVSTAPSSTSGLTFLPNLGNVQDYRYTVQKQSPKIFPGAQSPMASTAPKIDKHSAFSSSSNVSQNRNCAQLPRLPQQDFNNVLPSYNPYGRNQQGLPTSTTSAGSPTLSGQSYFNYDRNQRNRMTDPYVGSDMSTENMSEPGLIIRSNSFSPQRWLVIRTNSQSRGLARLAPAVNHSNTNTDGPNIIKHSRSRMSYIPTQSSLQSGAQTVLPKDAVLSHKNLMRDSESSLVLRSNAGLPQNGNGGKILPHLRRDQPETAGKRNGKLPKKYPESDTNASFSMGSYSMPIVNQSDVPGRKYTPSQDSPKSHGSLIIESNMLPEKNLERHGDGKAVTTPGHSPKMNRHGTWPQYSNNVFNQPPGNREPMLNQYPLEAKPSNPLLKNSHTLPEELRNADKSCPGTNAPSTVDPKLLQPKRRQGDRSRSAYPAPSVSERSSWISDKHNLVTSKPRSSRISRFSSKARHAKKATNPRLSGFSSSDLTSSSSSSSASSNASSSELTESSTSMVYTISSRMSRASKSSAPMPPKIPSRPSTVSSASLSPDFLSRASISSASLPQNKSSQESSKSRISKRASKSSTSLSQENISRDSKSLTSLPEKLSRASKSSSFLQSEESFPRSSVSLPPRIISRPPVSKAPPLSHRPSSVSSALKSSLESILTLQDDGATTSDSMRSTSSNKDEPQITRMKTTVKSEPDDDGDESDSSETTRDTESRSGRLSANGPSRTSSSQSKPREL